MEAYQHIFASFVLAVPIFITHQPMMSLYSVLYFSWAMCCGVLIDLDHFLISRYNYGDWRHLSRALMNPLSIVRANGSVKSDSNEMLTHKQKFSSHFLIAIVLSVAAFQVDYTAGMIAVTFFGLHIVMDIFAASGLLFST